MPSINLPRKFSIREYTIIRQIGRGGFAEVYLAEHTLLGSEWALKLLTDFTDPADRLTFQKEAQVAHHFQHAHIVRVDQFFVEPVLGSLRDVPVMVMDYAPHGSLRDLMNKHPLPHDMIILFAEQIASALQYIHSTPLAQLANHALVHRDIKPENILLKTPTHTLLSDFGLFTPSQQTKSLQQVDKSGTVPYMSPEQIRGRPVAASDQYSFAVMLWEMLTRILPFADLQLDTVSLAVHHLSNPLPELPRTVSLPTSTRQAVSRVLQMGAALEPKQRYANDWEFFKAFRSAMIGNQPTPYPVTPAPAGIPPAAQPAQPAPQLVPAASSTPKDRPKVLLSYSIKRDADSAQRWKNFLRAFADVIDPYDRVPGTDWKEGRRQKASEVDAVINLLSSYFFAESWDDPIQNTINGFTLINAAQKASTNGLVFYVIVRACDIEDTIFESLPALGTSKYASDDPEILLAVKDFKQHLRNKQLL